MYRKIILPIILMIVFVALIVFIVGIKESIQLSIKSTTNKEKVPVENLDSEIIDESDGSNQYKILMLGDSLGLGSGDAKGSDIGSYYKMIQSKDNAETIQTINIARNGAKIKDLLTQIEREETKALIKKSNLIILSIGGNDMKTILESSDLNLLLDYQVLAQIYEETFKEILNNIKKSNPEGQVAIIGLYNPFGEEISKEKVQILLNWNHLTKSIIENYSNVAYIETYDLFKYNLSDYLSIDAFHPNTLGYKAISRQLSLVLDGFEE